MKMFDEFMWWLNHNLFAFSMMVTCGLFSLMFLGYGLHCFEIWYGFGDCSGIKVLGCFVGGGVLGVLACWFSDWLPSGVEIEKMIDRS